MVEKGLINVVVGRFPPVVELGLMAVLRRDDHVRVLASNLDEACIERAVARLAPDVAIVGEAVEHRLLARLKSRQPVAGILIFAQSPAPITGTTLLDDGATCIAWAASPTEICTAVQRTAEGEPMFLVADDLPAPGPVVADALTRREIQVFGLLSLGRSYAQIADALHIAPETARTHTISICRKLKVANKRDLIGMSLATRLDPHTVIGAPPIGG